jgi:protein required for attachment to host cells
MQLPHGATVVVADGAKLVMFRNTGNEADPSLTELPHGQVDVENMDSGKRHQSSAANPDDSTQNEDAFASGVADILNKAVLGGKIDALLVIAAPKTLGELRINYHKTLQAKLIGEIAKDLTGHDIPDILKSIAAA